MPETDAGTYATLAGIEFVNNVRTIDYLKNGLGPGSLNVFGDCSCSNIIQLLDCPTVTGYVSPASDNAPWYTPDVPESAGFLGFYVDTFTGMESTFERSVVETVNHGGVFNRSRLKTKDLVWRGFLFGDSCCSVQYGLSWLKQTLSRFGANCRDCFGDDLELLICCPSPTDTSSPFRLLKGVGLTEGPLIKSERKTCTSNCEGSCGGSCIIEIEFTLTATQPYFYSPEIPVYDCVSIGLNSTDIVTDPAVDCGPFDCSDAYLDLACALPELPPTATYTNTCIGSPIWAEALYLSVPRSSWSALEEVVPVITIRNNSIFSFSGVQLGFYSSFDGNPCGDLVNGTPNCDVLCDDLLIFALPGRSTFYIDGRTRKMSMICDNNNTAFPGERHTSGPWSWPVFRDLGFCMETKVEASDVVNDVCISISLIPRTF